MKLCYVITEEDSNYILSCTNSHEAKMTRLSTSGFFAERAVMEDRPDFKQVIPVFVLRDKKDKRILLYQRKGNHTETRLAGLWTCGFGGHIDPGDDAMIYGRDVICTLDGKKEELPYIVGQGLAREMLEETGINIARIESSDINFHSFIYDPTNDVGRVHLGLCFIIDVDLTPDVMEDILSKPEIGALEILETKDIKESMEIINYEGWAEIILNEMIEDG